MASRSFVRKFFIISPLTIKGKLFISALSELLLVVVFSIFLIISSGQSTAITANETKSIEIVKTITEIRFVTFENLLNHNERSYRQWQTKHNQLTDILNNFPVSNPREQMLIDNIRIQQKDVKPIFDKLVASYSEPVTNQNLIIQGQYQERLASQLVSKQQIKITEALKLANLKRDDAARIRSQANSLVVAVIMLMFLITMLNFMFIYVSITRALAILQAGAREISKGKFNYRIKYKRRNDEFGLLAMTFNNMADSLQQVDKVKSEFVLLVSHQLRTPATAVKGFISMLFDIYNEGLTPKQRDYLSSAYEENERQIKLINEILAVAQVETGEIILNKQPTDIAQVIKSISTELQPAMTARGQATDFKLSGNQAPVVVDSEKIRIVIENLISNASKFSPANTTVKVKLTYFDTKVEIIVKDQGPGIAEEDLEKLFKKFSRISNPVTAKTEGTGLGLYLAKRIIDLHGGNIDVNSNVGNGTAFTVQLPNETKA